MEKLDNIVMYSIEDVRKLLHICNAKCLEMFRSEEFPSIKIGRTFWVKADCLNQYLSERHVSNEEQKRKLELRLYVQLVKVAKISKTAMYTTYHQLQKPYLI